MKKSNIYKDCQYGVAIVAAPLVWLVLYWIGTPVVNPAWVLAAPLQFLMLAVVQPVLEELVFRGLLQDWLIRKIRANNKIPSISFANIMTSVLFTALHFLYHEPLMAAAVFIPSLVFGYFRDRYEGWLIPSIGLHCFYNTGYFLIYSALKSQLIYP